MKGKQSVSRNLSSAKLAVITQTWDVILLGFINSSLFEAFNYAVLALDPSGLRCFVVPYKMCVLNPD